MSTTTSSARRGPKPRPDTKDNLIKAGMAKIHQMGYSATGIKDIVDEAGVPKGSFYNHFESKEAFAEELIDSYFALALPSMKSQLENPELSPVKRLYVYFNKRAECFVANGFSQGCLLGNFSLEIADHSPRIRERVAHHFETWSVLIEKCIAEAQRIGEIKSELPPELLARFVLNSWEGALVRMRAVNSDAPLDDFMKIIFTAVLV